MSSAAPEPDVRRIGPPGAPSYRALSRLLQAWQLELRTVRDDAPIPGSYWGEHEAGLVGATLFVHASTPVHSALHEACHFICMDPARRATLHGDAGGDDLEECAVCYLSILLADALPGFGRSAMLADMDAWGYSFRLGSARRWFSEDAGDARAWLRERGHVDADGRAVVPR